MMQWMAVAVIAGGLLTGTDDEKVAELRAVLENPKAEGRNKALFDVGDLGADAAPLIPLVVQVMETAGPLDATTLGGAAAGMLGLSLLSGVAPPTNETRRQREVRLAQLEATNAMMALGKLKEHAVQPLLDAMTELEVGEGGYRRVELTLVSCCKAAAEFPWDALEIGLKSASPVVRGAAALAVSANEAESAKAVPLLLDNLKHSNPHVRWRSIEALYQLGVDEVEVGSALVRCLDDPEVRVQAHAVRTLRAKFAGTAGAAAALDRCLRSKEDIPCALALETLAEGGVATKDQVKVVVKALGHKSGLVRLQAIRAMQKLDPDNRSYLSKLKRLEKDKDGRVARAAKGVLGRR